MYLVFVKIICVFPVPDLLMLFKLILLRFIFFKLRVTVDSEPVRQVTSTKTLGLTLDENLTWKNHIELFLKKFLLVLGLLNVCVD